MVKLRSICSGQKPICFYWRECVSGRHIDEAVEFLMALIASDVTLHTNDYLDADNEVQFARRLRLAQRGKLKPIDHVKAIQSVPVLDMFEIRWSNGTVTAFRKDPVSGMLGDTENLEILLYYIEGPSTWVVGMHAHIKAFADTEEETRALQDAQIERAVEHAVRRAAARWGIPELFLFT